MLRLSLLALLAGTVPALALDLKTTVLENRAAYIPPQCYTKTEDAQGVAHNPCQTCRITSYNVCYTKLLRTCWLFLCWLCGANEIAEIRDTT